MSKWIVIISLALFSLNCRQANGKELTRVSMDSIADMVGFRANGSLRLLATRGFEFTISDGSKTQKVVGKGFDKKDIIKCKFSANRERIVAITGPIRNLLFTSPLNISYKYHLSAPQGDRETVVVFTDSLLQLDISQCQSVRNLLCREYQLTELDVTHNPDLEQLDCSENRLRTLDMSQNRNLQVLFCSKNQLKDIDVIHNQKLRELVCFDNENLSLDVSANRNLEFLSCDGLLQELDVTNNIELRTLICRCKLTALDLSQNKKLRKLLISGNNFSAEELNAVFKTLPVVDYYNDTPHPELEMSDIPGAENCDRSLLRQRGWSPPENGPLDGVGEFMTPAPPEINFFTIGHTDDGAELHDLKALPITEEQYLSCDINGQKLLKKQIKEDEKSYCLNINNVEVELRKDTVKGYYRGGESWWEYVGYYPDLDMYAFLSCYVSGDLITFSDCMLIDQERGNEYLLLALGDAFGSAPLLSPNNDYLLDYSNSGDGGGSVRIFKINDKEVPASYIIRYAEESKFPFFIKNIIWKSDSEIFIKAYSNEDEKEYEYYKILLN